MPRPKRNVGSLIVALLALAIIGAAGAQSAPALEIAPPHDDDPRVTQIRPDSAPAIPLDRSTTVRRDALVDVRPYPYGGRDFTCESQSHGFNRCPAPDGRIRLRRQLSRAACVEGRDWGVERRAVWVDNGCRASFRAD
ncbi:DUF3011 domain-containing protein [Stenotrophomonas sp. C3(2023)]|uniref:DUF3011 domain-containing protein n=1 Tax=Stenotrophomonas sp. C3(2023) TaxID=3080277 RepID=UPI00293CF480|nr:DUF3011 domain-containing protein [Stenotrophomonas sp. C3(2023)]MDV3467385.1 DUF3011 domain-containing protein [Stenotrophomonas sp. C3(2023)]